MVVNASPENPCILEFGYGEKSGNLIEQYRTCDEEKIYYLYGGTYFSEEGFKEAYSSDIVENIVSISPKPNYALSEKIDYLYSEYKSLKNTMGLSSDYGIIDYGDLPSGTVFTGDLTEIYSLSWARTSDTSDENNCGPTSGTNALIFFGNLLGVNFVPDKATTNSALHSAMKTGSLGTSVSNYCSGLKAYVKDKSPSRTVTTSSSTGYSWNTLKSNVQNDKMAVAYIRPIGIGAAHYINYVGYRQYYSDYQVNYVRILDNWNDTSDKYILYDTSYSSRVVSTTTINIT